ncbi:hypothetical protein FGB62_63g09 [Gracilaria domingensis]|nr:hypothetical protein FGB62_63g09 [Gracilaria domingensis]
MVRSLLDLRNVIDAVHSTMSDCKRNLRDAALMRNLVELKPILHNETRWSRKPYMLERYLRIHGELSAVSSDPRSSLYVDTSHGLLSKVQRYTRQLRGIDEVTKYLQSSGPSLFDCQDALDMLVEDVASGINNHNSGFYACFLKKKYIAPDANILPDPFFESESLPTFTV